MTELDQLDNDPAPFTEVYNAAVDNAAKIAELEAQLATANQTIADLRDLAYNRAPKITAEEANRQKAKLEAQLTELRAEREMLRADELKARQGRDAAMAKITAIEARLREAEAKLNAHRRFHGKAGCPGSKECYVCALDEHSAWPQENIK